MKHLFLYIGVLILSTIACNAQKTEQVESREVLKSNKTSNNFKPLKTVFELNLEADVNNDSILTEQEYRDFQFVGIRRNRFKEFSGYYKRITDIPYAAGGEEHQKLDVIIPVNRTASSLPVIIFVHGGGWKKGDKCDGYPLLDDFLKEGNYIGVSINYRLTNEAKWPAQLHDCKAAIRWVKANAEMYGIDKEKIGLWGTSAGGHLVSMLAVTANNERFEGVVGSHLTESASVTCAINGFGPSDLMLEGTLLNKVVYNDFSDPGYNVFNLIGVEDLKQKAKNASPIYWVHNNVPPFLSYHGVLDEGVPIKHSDRLHEKLKAKGAKDAYLLRIENMEHGHGGGKFTETTRYLFNFFERFLREKPIKIDAITTLKQP
ncbi:alpha/beta hydrolase [Flavivirga amylovorans]|uniref:Alpha/beta hydrolase n=1 Tax=Flavivirga amylovorans TaxID=870486 RepID=A0ABT8WWZ6_9FLAO|nr:alpha/beta hydrolase [Flavivirga amylovorans]MDO5986206.1 alpha/beta hydrolase [Flavivirga amylovorans]